MPHDKGIILYRNPIQRVHYESEVLFVYAVFTTGGKQYKVQEGEIIYVEKLGAEADETVTFETVLAVQNEDGIKVGAPYVEGAKIEAKVIKNDKAKKITIIKYKSKKNEKKKMGHRQPYSKISIEKIVL